MLAPPHRALSLCALFVATTLAGCLGGADDVEALTRPDWQVGDRWVYQRSSSAGAATSVYVREVSALVEKDGFEAFEVTEGVRGHPLRQYMLYTVDDLRFMGMDVREAGQLLQRLDPERPLPFHYVLPLRDGHSVETEGVIHQVAGGVQQRDTVHVEAAVAARTTLVLGERVYEVWPYEIRITYTTTPFEDTAVIRGHWAPLVGQSVLTTVDQAGERRTYELLSFERAKPRPGGPAYGLVPGLASHHAAHGFDAHLEDPGFARYLFHVERPQTVAVSFSFPLPATGSGAQRIDLAAIRPLGYARAGFTSAVDAIAADGVVLHLTANEPNGEAFVFHAPQTPGLDTVRLVPGQVYELLLASNRGGLSARVELGAQTQALAPAETGDVHVLALNRTRVREATPPGPQNVRHTVTAIVALPEGTRVEGLVYARNHGGEDQALGELQATRGVTLSVDGVPFEDPHAMYGFYMHYGRAEPFRVDATFRYQADAAVQGMVDYELGALLVRLLPAT